MKFKNILLLILPLSLLNVSSCNNNSIQEDVLTAKKLVVQADDVISYIPLNSEYLPGESVTFQITSSKLSTQEFKVYLNDEELADSITDDIKFDKNTNEDELFRKYKITNEDELFEKYKDKLPKYEFVLTKKDGSYIYKSFSEVK